MAIGHLLGAAGAAEAIAAVKALITGIMPPSLPLRAGRGRAPTTC
ncbi:hypothetical protein [Breoghania sp.]|nr:hypothetical protein [Breoghania sp.]MDJ0932047.1 hypothetical protein [Breoghania sp.]